MLPCLLQQKIKLSHFLCPSFLSANALLDFKNTFYLCSRVRGKVLKFRYFNLVTRELKTISDNENRALCSALITVDIKYFLVVLVH